MRPTARPLIALLLLLTPAHAADKPTLQTITAAYDKGDYRAALRAIAELMPSTEASGDARYTLFRYKGESLLRLKQKSYAADAFDDAARAAAANNDNAKALDAHAAAVLVRAAHGPAYTPPKPPGAPAIDILDPESRKRAMAALALADLARIQPQLDRALAGQTLPPLRQLLDPLADAYALELAGTGKDDATRPPLQKLGEHARSLIEKELARVASRVEQLHADAGQLVILDDRFGNADDIVRKGLDTHQRRELEQTVEYLSQIAQAVHAGRRAATTLRGAPEKWDALLAQTTTLADQAAQVRDRRY